MDSKTKALIAVLAVLLLAAFTPHKARAAEITIIVDQDDTACTCSLTAPPACCRTIQAAIDVADNVLSLQTTTNTYSVLVEPDTYAEQLTLKRNINVRGRETARTVLTGGGSATVVTANTNNVIVNLQNFTIIDAAVGISVTGSASVNITNNVFRVPGGTAVLIQNAPSTTVINNTFYQNNTAVSTDAQAIQIKNNIFSNNSTAIGPAVLDVQTNILNNAFFFNTTDGPKGKDFVPNNLVTGLDPFFVNAAGLDFHLKITSPCIDNGINTLTDKLDATRSDIGAYGGQEADTIPFPVSGVTAVASPDATSVTVNWTANTSYAVDGYRVWYGKTSRTKSGVYDSTDALEGASPIDVPGSDVTSQILSDLSFAVTTTLPAPALNPPQPVNEGFRLSWSAVPNATGYKIHYGAVSTDENTVEAGNSTSYTLTGLKNGPENVYKISVSAVAQTGYFIAVTAYDLAGLADNLDLLIPGEKQESVFSPEVTVGAGAITESARSNEVSDFPEALAPYPSLRNSPQGCFIATAAFGHYSASQVRALRAFRDRYLLTNRPGSAFVTWYYAYGPAGAAWLNEHPGYKPLVRTALMPAVGAAYLMTHTPPALVIGVFLFAVFAGSFAIYRGRFQRRKGSR